MSSWLGQTNINFAVICLPKRFLTLREKTNSVFFSLSNEVVLTLYLTLRSSYFSLTSISDCCYYYCDPPFTLSISYYAFYQLCLYSLHCFFVSSYFFYTSLISFYNFSCLLRLSLYSLLLVSFIYFSSLYKFSYC